MPGHPLWQVGQRAGQHFLVGDRAVLHHRDQVGWCGSMGDLVASLTDREREVLDHVAGGQSNKVIAKALDISHNTVKLHVRHIMGKLNLRSRVEAAVFAFEYRSSPDGVKAAGEAAEKAKG